MNDSKIWSLINASCIHFAKAILPSLFRIRWIIHGIVLDQMRSYKGVHLITIGVCRTKHNTSVGFGLLLDHLIEERYSTIYRYYGAHSNCKRSYSWAYYAQSEHEGQLLDCMSVSKQDQHMLSGVWKTQWPCGSFPNGSDFSIILSNSWPISKHEYLISQHIKVKLLQTHHFSTQWASSIITPTRFYTSLKWMLTISQ